jgi:hypothetical protein
VPDLPFFGEAEEAVRAATKSDLGALADEVIRLTEEVALSADERAQALVEEGLMFRERAEQAFERAGSANDFADVTAAIGRGRYVLACAQARLDGAEAPTIRQPCFFDPSHGPAEGLIAWSPPRGDPRTVPACASDTELIEADVQPEPRRVVVAERAVPYWEAPWYFVPWFSGFFESVEGCAAEDLLAGLPLGDALTESPGEAEDLVISRKELRDRWDAAGTEEETPGS